MPSLRWSNVGLILQLGFVTVLSPTLELFCYGSPGQSTKRMIRPGAFRRADWVRAFSG